MSSWVRYSVAVYLGLLLAGALVGPEPPRSNGATAFWLPGIDERPATPMLMPTPATQDAAAPATPVTTATPLTTATPVRDEDTVPPRPASVTLTR